MSSGMNCKLERLVGRVFGWESERRRMRDIIDQHREQIERLQATLEQHQQANEGPNADLSGDIPCAPNSCSALALARQFHDTYERLAPSHGYETRPDTRDFDPDSPNGRLMTAVCKEILTNFDTSNIPAGNIFEEIMSEEIKKTWT